MLSALVYTYRAWYLYSETMVYHSGRDNVPIMVSRPGKYMQRQWHTLLVYTCSDNVIHTWYIRTDNIQPWHAHAKTIL